MWCFDISEFRSFQGVEKWGLEIARRILTIVCEGTRGSGLENLVIRGLKKWCLE
jgi:hypothetical protein